MPVLTKPEPFLKWAGRKDYLDIPLPPDFGAYYEPFLGSGGYFWRNASQLLQGGHECYLSDANDRLISTWQAIAGNPVPISAMLAELEEEHRLDGKTCYYKQRDRFNNGLSPIANAAVFLYLNRTCFNGLYRENASGGFNVPMGDYAKPKLELSSLLEDCHQWLSAIAPTISCAPFQRVLDTAQSSDFIYLDPPYAKLKPGTFDSYVAIECNLQEQVAQTFAELDRRGCHVLASNHDTPLIRSLYGGYHMRQIGVRRSINCKAEHRGKVGELAIANFPI